MDLFGNTTLKEISIKNAAKQIKVSAATINNWIKVGSIVKTRRGFLNEQVFLDFVQSSKGEFKLNSRANKSSKDSHDHLELSEEIIRVIENEEINIETVGNIYESRLSDSYRNKEGIYYTPSEVVNLEFGKIDSNVSKKTFCDPSCGSGNYIIAAIEHGFEPELIFGYDIDPIAVEITKERILKKTGYRSNNIQCLDYLKESISLDRMSFDYIMTNPPWGKKLDKNDKEVYRKRFSAGSSVDTCSLFMFASIERLNKNGIISFLLPESFFNVASFENARIKLLSLNLTHLTNYGRAFEGLLTRAQSFTVENKNDIDTSISNTIVLNEGVRYHRLQGGFVNNPKNIINLHANSEDDEVIKVLFRENHITLKNSAKWGLGIVTGNNKKFLRSEQFEKSIPVYKGADIKNGELRVASNYLPSDLSLYQQVAPLSIYLSNPKIVYKFISTKISLFVDYESRFFLNSANMFVLDTDFPITEQQVVDLFNSDIINWLYEKIFNSHKILRRDLESLPIHIGYFSEYNKFDEEKFLMHLGLKKLENGTYRVKR